VNEANIEQILGQGATVPDARSFIREALGGNSLATLEHAKRYAENAR
jgi:aromatase